MKKFILPFVAGIVVLLCIAAVRRPVYTASATQILAGTSTTSADNTVTNTFSTAFASAPIVTVSSVSNALPHTITITSSNVIFGAAAAVAVKWIAVGSP